MTRKVCIITGTRADYGLLRWVMQGIKDDADLNLQIIATGMHLSPEFGLTYKAIEMDGIVLNQERSERSKKLRILSDKLQRAHYEKFIGTTQTALMERENKNGFLFGYTDNYIKVKIPFNKELVQQKLKIKLLSHDENGNIKSEINKEICTQL